MSVPASADTTDIIFGATVRPAPLQDLASPFTLRSMIFNADNYILGGSSINFEGPSSIQQNSNSLTISNPLAVQSTLFYIGAGSASLNGVISGPGRFTKGPGNLTLGNANTFTGDTRIDDGQLRLGNALALQNSTVHIGLNDALSINGPSSVTLGNLSGPGNWNVGSATVTVGGNGSSPSAYSGTFTGTGTINKVGNGTLTLGGAGSTADFMSVTGGSVVLDGGSLKLRRPFVALDIRNQSMTVRNGAQLDSVAGIANVFGIATPAAVTITGVGSRWDASSVSFSGAGTSLIVEAGGAISTGLLRGGGDAVPSNFIIRTGGTALTTAARVGETGGAATATISGAGSMWTSGGLTIGRNGPGGPGPGIITVSDGGAFVINGRTDFDALGGSLTVNRGTFATGLLFDNPNSHGVIHLTDPAGGAALTINGSTGSGLYAGSIDGTGSLVKSNGSSQTLNGALSYTGSTTVNGGTLLMTANASRSFTVDGGTLQVPYADLGTKSFKANPGGAILYQNATISGGFLRGAGSHDIGAVTRIEGTTIGSDAVVNQANPLTMLNVTSGGEFNSNAQLTLDGFVLTSAGQLTFNNNATIEAFESAGLLTITQESRVDNVGSSNLVFGGGSRTFIGEERGEGGSLVLRGGTSLVLNGALLVNNGTIDGPTNINFGSLAKGAGRYGEINVTDGGKFSPGNSPGWVTTGSSTWNSGGSYLVEIADAIAGAGIGWDLWNIAGILSLNASSSDNGRFVISLASLAGDASGPAANFNPNLDHHWIIARAEGGIFGFDPVELSLDTSGFKNNLSGGHFSFSATSTDLIVNFSAVPEPASIALLFITAVAVGRRTRKLCK
jgi:autotransporter-associated beta strand protein